MSTSTGWVKYAEEYDPIKVASIDGLGTEPHDRAVTRAITSKYNPPTTLESDPKKTLFVGRLHDATTEETLIKNFSKFGTIKSVRLIRDIVTGLSKCYAFVEFKHRQDARDAHTEMNQVTIDNCKILVDFEHGRVMPGWKPRRLGGGFGGKKESGQLRFGCRDRPFQRPPGPSSSTSRSRPSSDLQNKNSSF